MITSDMFSYPNLFIVSFFLPWHGVVHGQGGEGALGPGVDAHEGAGEGGGPRRQHRGQHRGGVGGGVGSVEREDRPVVRTVWRRVSFKHRRIVGSCV